MKLEFCPNCGTVLRPKRDEDKVYLICINCGFKRELNSNEGNNWKIKETNQIQVDSVFTSGDKEVNVDDTIRCPKCGRKGVYYIDYYDLSSDKGFTIFKCVYCGYTWREDD